MKVLFLSVNDLKNSSYRREGKKNLLDTKLGTADTLAFCGRLESAKKTKYGPRLQINDNNPLTVIVGTFNNDVRKDAEKIIEKFKNEKDMYLLLYGNPYETDQLYINVNQDNGVVLVDRETYEKFHEIRKEAAGYLREKLGTSPEKLGTTIEEEKPKEELPSELSNSEIMNFIKSRDRGEGVKTKEVLEHFKTFEGVEEKILELMELGELYEPKPGLLRVL